MAGDAPSVKPSRLDEDDVRVRPGRSKSRPRTKDRPNHADAVLGSVTTVDRGRITVLLDSHKFGQEIYAVKARELGRKGIVVGDRVALVGDSSGEVDSQARIIRREPRVTELRRTADDDDPQERVIVANAEYLGIVVAAAHPEPRTGLIDRAIVAALDAHITPFLVITKCDVGDPEALTLNYRALGLQIFYISHGIAGSELIEYVADKVTVFVGHSGVGKSTLINQLVPLAQRLTGEVNDLTGKGKHTSTSVIAFPLPQSSGIVIDTPGIRSFGLAHVSREVILQSFSDLAVAMESCPRACSHNEPDCALNNIVDTLGRQRVESLQSLLAGNTILNP
jgi:ribosome biogenesis GTPase / thiamine phosphate phosphatase